MLFDSVEFLIFFVIVFYVYWALGHKLQNLFLLAASFVFYGWWSYKFLLLMVGCSVVNFYFGAAIGAEGEEKKRRLFLVSSLVFNLGILFVFKYFDFFMGPLVGILRSLGIGNTWVLPNLILPVGISFYTFQGMAYSFDVYRKTTGVHGNLLEFVLYKAFFPLLVAGPIERPHGLLRQISEKRVLSFEMVLRGVALAALGYLKKVVFADNLAVPVDAIFSSLGHHSALDVFLGSILFSLEIYFDFSGYSDIARGVALALGFDLTVNFKAPYLARNAIEFWERWHISLSTWFRDYVYFPLAMKYLRRGESFVNKYKAHFITMALMGFWHGAAFTFVVFGIYWALIICMTHAHSETLNKLPRFFLVASNLFFVCFGWFLFRIRDLGKLRAIRTVFPVSLPIGREALVSLLLGGLLLIFLEDRFWFGEEHFALKVTRSNYFRLATIAAVMGLCILLALPDRRAFIYFQF